MCIFEQEELHMRYTFWSVFAIKNCLGGKCIKFPTNIFFFISCIFYWFRCNDGYTFSVSFFLFLNIALVMKITIKIPFYERFHLMLFVYRIVRESGKWWLSRADKQTRRDLGWMFTDYDDNSTKRLVQNIFLAWGRMNNPTELPPIDMNYILQVNIHNLTLLTSNV